MPISHEFSQLCALTEAVAHKPKNMWDTNTYWRRRNDWVRRTCGYLATIERAVQAGAASALVIGFRSHADMQQTHRGLLQERCEPWVYERVHTMDPLEEHASDRNFRGAFERDHEQLGDRRFDMVLLDYSVSKFMRCIDAELVRVMLRYVREGGCAVFDASEVVAPLFLPDGWSSIVTLEASPLLGHGRARFPNIPDFRQPRRYAVLYKHGVRASGGMYHAFGTLEAR